MMISDVMMAVAAHRPRRLLAGASSAGSGRAPAWRAGEEVLKRVTALSEVRGDGGYEEMPDH